MQGLVDFANQIGEVFSVLVPTLCYLAALFCFLFAVWGFWMQSHPQNPFFGRPWIPFLSLVLCGVFASFDKFLNMALATAGSSVTASVTSLSSYSPPTVPDGATLMGASPSATLVNVVTLFQAFFQSFGALVVFFSIVSWRSVVNGQANRSQMGCVVQAVFGIMLINILAITNVLVAMFVA
ncbi:MAG: hypothetical protein JO136_11775 [Hyphomicrobiales bacterium]|nr:hypothetical protein [Hyphomicrobiales bacterium]MBV9908757.1 hypothetical protein [Hyphomicrobiales bacterium]